MRIGARVLMATAVLFLPAAATGACPPGWTPSPANAAWGPRCFFVPPERSTSLSRCVDLCEEHGGIPACMGSAAENDFVTAELALADGLGLGLYESETGLGQGQNGEEACENKAFDSSECAAVGCCYYNRGQCRSSVGADPCNDGKAADYLLYPAP